MPSTCARNVLQQEQRARYSPTISSMKTISPKAISRTGRLCVVFASADLAALRTRKGLGGASKRDDAGRRLNGIHACVPLGLVLLPQEGTGWFFGKDQLLS